MREMRVILEWQCEICKDIQLSDSIRTHHMDYCRCGESAVDLEDEYQRDMGKIKEIKRIVTEEQSLPSSFRSEHKKKWATPPEDTTSEDKLK